MSGDIPSAMKTLHNYHQVWSQYGFTPEFYNIPQLEAGANRENYPLRPELIESIMYLYRATGDPYLMQAGVDILRSIQHSAKTPCGYATVSVINFENFAFWEWDLGLKPKFVSVLVKNSMKCFFCSKVKKMIKIDFAGL